MYKKYINDPTEINKLNGKNKRNRVVQILRKAEADYYTSFIKKHSDNSKQLWKRFGNILGKSKFKKKLNRKTIDN